MPRVYPTHLRGTGEGFAANIGGRMLGTGFAFVTTTLTNLMPGATPQMKLAYASAAVVTFVYAAGLVASRATIREDLAALLPDDRSAVGRDFALFSGTPLARTVLVALVAQPGAAAGALDEAAGRVEATLGPPLFSPHPAPADPARVAAVLPRALQVMAEPGAGSGPSPRMSARCGTFPRRTS